jgi:glycosyltransferase involved in cell wall biosynthesis
LLAGRVELLHLHMAMKGSFWRKAIFLALGRLAGVPVVIHLHGSEFAVFYERSSAFAQACIRSTFNRASAVVVLSESWHQFVTGFCTRPITVVKNFVPDQFDPARAATARRPRAVLFLGLFGERKGIYDLLKAWAIVHQRVPDAVLYCGGNGEVDKVRQTVSELGLEVTIQVPGWVSGEQKRALLHGCAVFALPSYHEGLPMAIIEAMSYSMAIVSTAVGGIPELVDRNNGRLVRPGDPVELAQALVELLLADDLARLGAVSRERYRKEYTPEAAASHMRDVYRTLGIDL